MNTNPFVDPNLTRDDIPDEDLRTLARLAGEKIRREEAELRAAGRHPDQQKPSKPADPATEKALSR